jgi:hypothetical protein
LSSGSRFLISVCSSEGRTGQYHANTRLSLMVRPTSRWAVHLHCVERSNTSPCGGNLLGYADARLHEPGWS